MKVEKKEIVEELMIIRKAMDNLERMLLDVETNQEVLELKVTNYLNNLGMPVAIDGYECVKEAIIILSEDKTDKKMGDLYKEIGDLQGKSWQRVERTIRYAIRQTLTFGNHEFQKKVFNKEIKKTTNSEFIKKSVQYILH